MPVKMDWEIDDIEAPLPQLPESESGPGRWRRWGMSLALITLLLASGLSWLKVTLQGKQQKVERELRAAIQVELNALLNGDRDLFLSQQALDDRRWKMLQEQAFDHYHTSTAKVFRQAAPARYTDAEIEVHVEGDQGWALIPTTRAPHDWREVWFYRWTQADGWRHARLEADWLGDSQTLTTAHLRFIYPEREEEIVTALAAEMEAGYEMLAPLLGISLDSGTTVSVETALTVTVSYRDPTALDPPTIEWEQDAPYTLHAPAFHQGYLSADGSATAATRQQMLGYLADALIARTSGLAPQAPLPVEAGTLRQELRDWSVARWAQANPRAATLTGWTLPSTPLLDALVARAGVEIIPALVKALPTAQTLDQVLAIAGIDPPDPRTRFTFLLNAEAWARTHANRVDYEALADPEADPGWLEYYVDQWSQPNADGIASTAPQVQIESVVFNRDIAWVETQVRRGDGALYYPVYFFRHAQDRWLLTSPDLDYLGQPRTAQTENLVLHYYERDQAWYETATMEALQAILDRAAGDLGLDKQGWVLTLEITPRPGLDGWQASWEPNKIYFTAPHILGWSPDDTDAPIYKMGYALVKAMVRLEAGYEPDTPSFRPLLQEAIAQWEAKRLFPARTDPASALTRHVVNLSLQDLGREPENWDRALPGYYTLVEYMVASYGRDIIPALLEHLGPAPTLETWLYLVTGQGIEKIEPNWQRWVSTRYSQ